MALGKKQRNWWKDADYLDLGSTRVPGWEGENLGDFSSCRPRSSEPVGRASSYSGSPLAVGRWREDQWMFPIEDYEDRNLVVQSGRTRVLSCEERELLLGFAQGHTLGTWNKTRRAGDGFGFKAARGILVGQSVSAYAVAWILQLMLQPLVAKPVALEALWQHSEVCLDSFTYEDWHLEALGQMIRRSMHKGGDVRLATGTLLHPSAWPRRSIEPAWWHWKVVLSYPQKGRHINVQELHAVLQSYRWKMRSKNEIRTRAVHALDSQVAMSVIVKGRSSSRQLNYLLKKLNALILACSGQLALVYVRTDLNPADKPSRWHHDE